MKLVMISSWVVIAPVFLIGLLVFGYQYNKKELVYLDPLFTFSQNQTRTANGSIISRVKGMSTDMKTGDARPIIIAEFLEKHDSPLKPYDYYGQFLTDIADKYNLDFRLLPSIMMQESNLCKKIPEGSYNCLGLGIHSRGTWTFSRYEDNFEAAAKILRENYIDKGYITPDQIQEKYTPGSNGSWEFAVNHFMDILEKAEF